MSDAIIPTNWAEPATMAHYRGIVQASADEWLALHPRATRRIELSKPEKCALAHYLLDDDTVTMAEAAKQSGLTEKELGQLVFRRPVLWEKRKKSLAAKSAFAAELIADATIKKANAILEDDNQLAETPIKDLALAFGIMGDKAGNLNGEASLKIEHVTTSKREEFEELREAARKRLAEKSVAIEAEIISNGSEMAKA